MKLTDRQLKNLTGDRKLLDSTAWWPLHVAFGQQESGGYNTAKAVHAFKEKSHAAEGQPAVQIYASDEWLKGQASTKAQQNYRHRPLGPLLHRRP